MGKNIGKNKYSQKLLDHAKQSATDALETFSKKKQKQLVIWLVIKFLIELQKFQKIHNEIIQRQLQISMIT